MSFVPMLRKTRRVDDTVRLQLRSLRRVMQSSMSDDWPYVKNERRINAHDWSKISSEDAFEIFVKSRPFFPTRSNR